MPSVSFPLPFEAYQGEEPYIFISYAHADAEIVYADIQFFHDLGYRIWYDEGIDPGNEWSGEVEKSILNCSCFIVFISPNSVASRNVRDEINLAISQDKDFLAIHLAPTTLPSGLNLRMGSIQAILKYNHTSDSYTRKIKKTLSQKLRGPSENLNSSGLELGEAARLEMEHHRKFSFVRRPKTYLFPGMALGILAVVLFGFILFRNFFHLPGQTPIFAAGTPTESSIKNTNVPDQNAGANTFADDILAAVAQDPPTYADNFDNANSGWENTSTGPSTAYFKKGYDGKGKYFLEVESNPNGTTCMESDIPGNRIFSDFVMEVDLQLVTDNTGDRGVKFRKQGDKSIVAMLIGRGGGTLMINLPGNSMPFNVTNFLYPMPASASQPDHLQILARGEQIALFVNGQQSAYTEKSSGYLSGTMDINLCSKSPDPVRVEFDNLKIWDIKGLKIPTSTP